MNAPFSLIKTEDFHRLRGVGHWVKLLMAAAAWLLMTGSLFAATKCKEHGSPSAMPAMYYTDDQKVLDGLKAALLLGLDPPTFPAEEIAKNPAACVQTVFTADGRSWTLYGGEDDSPPRWARAADGKMTVFLAWLPAVDEARVWAEAERAHPTSEPFIEVKSTLLAVVAAEGDKRRVFEFFDAIPDNAHLIQAMTSAIQGETPAILGFDVRTAQADEQRMIEPLTLGASTGESVPVDKIKPDGPAFVARPDGSARAPLSGLVCPIAADALRRSALFTTGADDGGREVGCRYVGERARIAIVATRADPGQSLEDAMARMIALPKDASIGQPVRMSDPPTMSHTTSVLSASFISSDNSRQGVWAFKRGDWFFELYALYGVGGEPAVSSALASLSAANKAP